ncbi:hypothetical protein [Sinorhizobium sp. BG8]|uniref:pectate lyase family protein n=1 Tax=Sinorhizobium sp. BG8 TaxID=2613773 RepID=UPI00193D19E6|nr:hypothetical protein [Sinorhizobium sp. BG8]QRM56436.1 pectate lyase [Sinorhizobium sp. BG8]
MTQGGRGGQIIDVTNLDDSGPGSLRACAEAEGPRNCVFRVSGVIRLERSIVVRKDSSNLSILGQTAPGSGIVITIDATNEDKKHTPLYIRGANDVIVRHIRVRPRLPNTVSNIDGLTTESSARVYVDHVSTSWATDENINTHANSTEITIANSIFAEGLNKHSKCALLGSDPRIPQQLTFWKNLCLSNRDRNPDNNHYGDSCIEIVNNVFFNARSEWAEIYSQFPGGTPISFVGNYFKAGPSTDDKTYALRWKPADNQATPKIYQSDNETWTPSGKTIELIGPDTQQFMVDKPPCALAIDKVLPAKQAYDEVRAGSGAFPRDALDKAWIEDLGDQGKEGRGKMVMESRELPEVDAGTPYKDEDADGMADSWEAQSGAEVGVNDAWTDAGKDGWTRFDLFMQWLSEERIAGRYPQ